MDTNQNPPPLFQLNLDANNGYTLRSAASWGKVLGVVGIIFSLLFFVMAILFQTSVGEFKTARYYGDDSSSASMVGNMGTAVYIVCGLVFLISSIFSLNFGNKIGRALKTNDQHALNSGFAALRNYFALWGILMIISLLLMVISIVTLASR